MVQRLHVIHGQAVEALSALAHPTLSGGTGGEDDEVGSQIPDLVLDLGLCTGAHRGHDAHRGHADDHPEHREEGPHLVLQDALARHFEENLVFHAAPTNSVSRYSAASCAADRETPWFSSRITNPSLSSTVRRA